MALQDNKHLSSSDHNQICMPDSRYTEREVLPTEA